MRRVLEIFISSPGDLAEERRKVAEVVGTLAHAAQLQQRGFSLRPLLYEEVVPPVLANGPQAAVNAFMIEPARCDVLVCVLGDRLGSEMTDPHDPSGKFVSGTVYETMAAYGSAKLPKPEVLIYYRRKARADANLQDRQKVEAFVAEIVSGKGPLKGISPTGFDDGAHLGELLTKGLDAAVTHVIRLYEVRRRKSWAVALGSGLALAVLLSAGVLRLIDAAAEREGATSRAAQLVVDAALDGSLKKLGELDVLGCPAAGPLLGAIGRAQEPGERAITDAAIGALAKLAAGSSAERCGCPELLSILATEEVKVRYCKSTHKSALTTLQTLSCKKKAEVIGRYLGKIRGSPSLKGSLFCIVEDVQDLNDLIDLAGRESHRQASLAQDPPP